jgi:signal transduction histidine kinase
MAFVTHDPAGDSDTVARAASDGVSSPVERSRIRRAAVVSLGLLAVYGWWQVQRWGGASHQTVVGDLFFVPLNAFAVLSARGAARRCRLQPRLRRCWQLVSIALMFYLVGDLVQTYHEVVGRARPFPSLADAAYLSFYPLVLAALLKFPSAPRNGRQQLTLVLDCALVALSGAVPIWYLSLGPTIAAGGQDATSMVVSVAYPLGDMVLLVGLATLLFRRVPAGLRAPLTLIAAGLLGFVVTDLIYSWITLHANYAGGDLIDAGWMVALSFFLAAGAAQPVMPAGASALQVAASHRLRPSWLPYLGLATTLGLAIFAERNARLIVVVVLAAALALAGLVCVRQLVVQAELLLTQRQLRAAQSDRAMLLDSTLRRGEEERIRIALELHDGPVQRLAALGYLLERAARLGRRGNTDRMLGLVDEALGELRGEVDGLRRLMSDLRPPVLDESGLDNALRDHLATLFSRTPVQAELVSRLNGDRVPPQSETVLYRVAQEAFLNICRHAGARHLLVSLERIAGASVLTIEDDGVGFSDTHARARLREGHFGLVGMRERVELAGGSWNLISVPGTGTRITATLPDHRLAPMLPRPRVSQEQEPAA